MKNLNCLLLIMSILLISRCDCGDSEKENSTKNDSTIEKVEFSPSWYWCGIPEAAKTEELPLVVAFHGDEGHPNNMKSYWQNTWLSNQDFIFVAPKCPEKFCTGEGKSFNTWSEGGYNGCFRQAEWLDDVISDVKSRAKVDTKRIFAVGYSGGGIFLSYTGFNMYRDYFAGIQIFCGGANETEEQIYYPNSNADCKTPARIVMSRSGERDYLVTAADNLFAILDKNGHDVELIDSGCDGHCCDIGNYITGTHKWFMNLPPKCAPRSN